MKARRIPVVVDLDSTNDDHVGQTPHVGPAMQAAVRNLTGIPVGIHIMARPARSEKSASSVRMILDVPYTDAADAFRKMSQVVVFMSSPLFSNIVDKLLADFSGTPSTIRGIELMFEKAVEVTAPGIVQKDPDPALVPMSLKFVREVDFNIKFQEFDVIADAVIADLAVGSLNFDMTPFEGKLPGLSETITFIQVLFSGILGFADPFKGKWDLDNKETIELTPDLVYSDIMDSKAVTIDMQKDGGDLIPKIVQVGKIVNASFMSHAMLMRQGAGNMAGTEDLFEMNGLIGDGKGGIFNKVYNETGPFDILKSSAHKLLVTNDTGEDIVAGPIGKLFVPIDTVKELI